VENTDSEANSEPTSALHTLPQAPRPTAFAFLGPPQTSDEMGRLGRFRVLKLLGEGGMGMVFLATDPDLDRKVALKVMKPEAASHAEGRTRFLREARTAAAVEHDNVVAILQVGEDGGVPFLVMPLLKGESLEDRLRRTPKLSAAETARLGREAADGLAAAHTAGLVHRDIKPSNLWLERLPDGRDRVKVLDFGLARPVENAEHLTRTDALMGTAGYMAPEQARAEPVDGRSDLFSLGCVLYRMCTGRAPFRGDTLTVQLLQLTTHNPPAPQAVDPTVPAALSDVVMRLLAKAPADRPASAREVAESLRAIESALPAATTLPSPTPTSSPAAADTAPASIALTSPGVSTAPTKPPRRRWTFTFAISITLSICVLAAVAAFQFYPGHVPHPADPPLTTAMPPSPAAAKVIPPPHVPTEFKGSIDVVVFDPDDGQRQNARLNQPGVLPLKPGDRFAVEAEISPPAYLYILWIDADGSVDPVYPWRRGHWDDRPAEEKPVEQVRRPALSERPFGGTFGIKESQPGMETLVMLARKTPLPRGVDLKAELGAVPPQKMRTMHSTAWCENGRVVTNEVGRSAVDWDDEKTDDPVWATQEQIRSRLGPGKDKLFHYTRAVSFAVRGK
jgi:serine/threonine protein kinase